MTYMKRIVAVAVLTAGMLLAGTPLKQEPLRVTMDPSRTIYQEGQTVRMTFAVAFGGSFDNLRLYVEPYGRILTRDMRTMSTIMIPTGGPAVLANYSWVIGRMAPGRYRLHATASKQDHPSVVLEWYSEVLTINRLPPATPEADRITLRLDEPGAGTITGWDGTLWIGWYCTVGRDSTIEAGEYEYPGEFTFAFVLCKDGADLRRFGPISYYGRRFSDWVPTTDFAAGGGYQVRLELYSPGGTGSTHVIKSVNSANFNIRYMPPR